MVKIGLGDNLLATGMAKGANARGKRIAFGDGQKIIWDHYSPQVFAGNPNIAAPGSETDSDLEWIAFYRGHRTYNKQQGRNWIWNYEFKAVPGEVYFTPEELKFGDKFGSGFIVIEPNVPYWKTVAPNKQWPIDRYQKLARYLKKNGRDVRQFTQPNTRHTMACAVPIKTPSFRLAMAVLRKAALYIGPEGGLHHAAAALGIPAVVLFGGFIPPAVTGYSLHTNLTGGAEACGSLSICSHCRRAMNNISVDEVHFSANRYLGADQTPLGVDRVRSQTDSGVCGSATLDQTQTDPPPLDQAGNTV